MYDDIDGFDSSNSGSQSRPVILPGSVGLKEAMEEKEEDIYEILPGETFRLLTTFLWLETLDLVEEYNLDSSRGSQTSEGGTIGKLP